MARGAKSCEDTRSTTELSNPLWGRSSKSFVKERAFPLVEDVEIDGALVAYSNDCFVQGIQHHHGSLVLAVVMGPLAVIQPYCWVFEHFRGSIDV